jgi:hypothetical protein
MRGTLLETGVRMIAGTRPASHRVVCWIFQRGNELLTCGVEWSSDRSTHTVSLFSNDSRKAGVVETFDSGVGALQRHAHIAARLREHGWRLVAYAGERSNRQADRPAAA